MMSDDKRKKLELDARERQAYDLKVFVVGGGYQYIQMFKEAGFHGAVNIEDADIICFTGGEDVDPSLYGEKPLPPTYSNLDRDLKENVIYEETKCLNKPMIGICRGSQFLNVMNKGTLWQHINNHGTMNGHPIVDMRDGTTHYNMTSTHHQQMIPGPDAEILALACLSTDKFRDGKEIHRKEPEQDDVEVVWYPNTLCLCFQPHPEFRHGECRDYFLGLVDEYIMPAC